MILSAKSILVSSEAIPLHIGVIADELVLEQKFFIDFEFILDHLVFPGVNHILTKYLSFEYKTPKYFLSYYAIK